MAGAEYILTVSSLFSSSPSLTCTLPKAMRVYLTDQTKKFPQHLDYLKRQPKMPYDQWKLREKTTVIPIGADREVRELNTGFFFAYKIFPSRIMSYLTQWDFEKRQMQIGDTIVQQAFIPPFPHFSQKIIFGVRINDIINEPTRIGFSYETLQGHVEKGISIFTIEKTADQKTIFKVHTFSTPGSLLTQLVAPIFSIPYQTFCTRQALLNVKRQLESS
jgi:Domain of unknown function (DUF1990)